MSNHLTKEQASKMREQVAGDLALVSRVLDRHGTADMQDAMVRIETFCAFAMRVMAKTNLSKLRDELRTVETCTRLAGKPVIDW